MLSVSSGFANEVYDCIIMCGQSNMEGDNSTGSPDSSIVENKNAFIFYKPNDASSTDNGIFETLLYGKNQSWRTSALTSNGPELSFAKAYTDANSKPVFILKYSYGGSALVDIGSSYANGLWQIDANPANVNSLPHYSNMINNFCIPAIQKLNRRGIRLNIKAISWCQGESDALDATRAANYETELTRLINQVRTDLAPYNYRGSDIKPIITRIHNNFSPARTYQNNIRTALVNVATAFGMSYINSDAYPVAADFVHWTRAGQKTHGEDIYTIFNSIT